MTDTEKLRAKIKESGYKLAFIAKQINRSHQGFLNKLNGESEFTISEVAILRELLNISPAECDEIFFANM